ncbi:MAG: hypothetical protein E7329_01185 [Clostridiales bacterium]|nr:hypothetical protein [Clostridiales bacterium]
MKQENYAYRKAMKEILEGLYELMADLEDVRDEAQETLDEKADLSIRADVVKMDEVLKKLDEAAGIMDHDA